MVEAGKLKANLTKLKAAYSENIAFMNKLGGIPLGPALNECNPANNFQPWIQLPCKGPCDMPWENGYVIDENCKKKLKAALSIYDDDVCDCDLKSITAKGTKIGDQIQIQGTVNTNH